MLTKIWKNMRPTSLYSRGLILILMPVVVLQLILGTLIFQRYFYQVIEQLTELVINDLNYVRANTPHQNWPQSFAQFGYLATKNSILTENKFGNVDVSGRLILRNFQKSYGQDVLIDSTDWQYIQLTIPQKGDPLNLKIPRRNLAPINPHQIMLNMSGFSVLLVILSWLFLRNQIRSLQKLSFAARSFGRGEVVRYIPSGSDEVRSAGRSFLAMRKRISRQREQRNLMMSGISHDLRTPLTRMRLLLEMGDDDETRAGILDEIAQIEALTNSFLSYAENDATEDFQLVDLAPFLAEVAANYANTIFTDKTEQSIDLRIRPLLMTRAIENLLNNAERYADRTEISLQTNGRDVLIYIDDNGPGIAQKDRESALTAFSRVDTSRNQDHGSHAGLGLAIAADAIRQHGGVLDLGDAPMGGLRVVVQLPHQIT